MGLDLTLEDLLPVFLMESTELLTEIDSQLTALKQAPHNIDTLNIMFRNFHTIKGGAGFLNALELANAGALITLCRLAESLLNHLRNGEGAIDRDLPATISATTAEVRIMLQDLSRQCELKPAPQTLLESLETALLAIQTPASPQHISRPNHVRP
jgi:two-component system chemotaxis sensor kinase CheA